MLKLGDFRGSRRVRGAAFAIALVVPVLTATFGNAEIIKVEDMARGITMTREQCAAILEAVWVNVLGRDYCVRYYMSTAGGEGRRPVVFLQGDQLGRLNGRDGTWVDTSQSRDVDTSDLMRTADGFSRMARTTAIYLARIGVDGSSGSHVSRKTVLERELMNAALDAIKKRYQLDGFHLAGQSGGSTILVGLLAQRTDIGCAVSGAGHILTGVVANSAASPDRRYFDPSAGIAEIRRNHPNTRFFFVTDPEDTRAPARTQNRFIQNFRLAGGQAEQLVVLAIDENRHGVLEYTRLVTAGCVLGKSNADIARAVSTIVSRNTELAERRKQEARARASAAVEQPASNRRGAPGNT
jgi:hypothetical protein